MADTIPESDVLPARARPVPGMLVVFSSGKPLYHPVVLRRGEPRTLGRADVGGLTLSDGKMSSAHAKIVWDGAFQVTDLESRNGTFVDGEAVRGEPKSVPAGVLRMGQTIALLVEDVGPFTRGEMSVKDGMVIGPKIAAVLSQVARARRDGVRLLVRGETGAGKELVAKTFHEAASNPGPLVAWNCATIQPSLAEAELFGTGRGAFNDARDRPGLFEAANGGVLFLDEIAELDPQVQPKLLRVLEDGVVTRVGENKPRAVKVMLVAASHRRLSDLVQQGKFRLDLMNRLNSASVELLPLRERREEIPWLMQLAARDQSLDSSIVEGALLRPWPGNVRELLLATQNAASGARDEGESVKLRHLREDAGREVVIEGAEDEDEGGGPEDESEGPQRTRPDMITREALVQALTQTAGNATRAAKLLNLHRTQIFRLREKFGVAVKRKKQA